MTAPPSTPVRGPRSLAVTMSALIVSLGGAGALVMAASLTASSAGIEELVPGGRLVARAMAIVLVLSAFAAVATGVGLWRLRHWSRIAILIIAGSLVAFCASSALVVLAMPMQELLGPDALYAQGVRTLMLTVYAIPGVIGVWWLAAFTRTRMQELFAADGPIEPSRLPLAIALVGWATLLAGVACLLLAVGGAPGLVGSVVVTGWSARLFYLLLAAVQLYIGRGLLRLEERARRFGVAFFALATALSIAGSLVPGMRDAALAYGRELGSRIDAPIPLDPDGVWWWISGLVIAGFAIPGWLLVRWRRVFRPSPAQSDTAQSDS